MQLRLIFCTFYFPNSNLRGPEGETVVSAVFLPETVSEKYAALATASFKVQEIQM